MQPPLYFLFDIDKALMLICHDLPKKGVFAE